MRLTLMEELVLLALHDEKGIFLGAQSLPHGLAAAVLLELVLQGRIRLGERGLQVHDDASCGDGLLDEALGLLAAAKRPRSIQDWQKTLSEKVKRQRERVAERLVERGVLKVEESRLLGIFPLRRFPTHDTAPERQVKDRIHRAVGGSRKIDARTACLVVLMGACGLTGTVFGRGERAEANRRVREIAKSDLLGTEIREILDGTRTAFKALSS